MEEGSRPPQLKAMPIPLFWGYAWLQLGTNPAPQNLSKTVTFKAMTSDKSSDNK